MESCLLDYSFLSRLLRVREAASEERKPGVSGLERTCKLSVAQNAFIMSLLRDCPASNCMLPLAESSLPSISEDFLLEIVSYTKQKS